MAELHVSKKTIYQLLSEMQGKKFIIPDYQRPYEWYIDKNDKNECQTLWDDIEDFAKKEGDKADEDYFLGTIVSYLNENKNQEIIDGQQRITSLLLMLRAFYCKLENMKEDDEVTGLKTQLAPCIWDIDPISQKVLDKSQIHILSQVAETNNEVFHDILKTGIAIDKAKDNYSKNYQFFKKQCDEYAEKYPLHWKK